MSDLLQLNPVGSLCSIASLFIAIYTLWLVKSVARNVEENEDKILFHNRIAEHLDELQQANFALAKSIDFYNSRQIKVRLSTLRGKLTFMVKRLPRGERKECRNLIKIVHRQYKSPLEEWEGERQYVGFFLGNRPVNKSDLWSTYDNISAFIDRLNNIVNDKRIVP
ncbi:MAG: hypothetical protein LUG51_00965 [Tannerellaceae bacterium]|nr:hypothetical protein [Tannerellaceae bacterium]